MKVEHDGRGTWTWLVGATMLSSLLVGCGREGGHEESGGETGGGACIEDIIEPPMASNPNFKGIIGGDGGTNYRRVTVGYVNEVASASTCCQDYAMAQMSGNKVRIRFGIDPTGLGFSASNIEDVTMGGNAEDILLRDINADNRNDLLALYGNGTLQVIRGTATSPYIDGAANTYSTTMGGHIGGLQMVIAELDCTAGLEVAMPSRNTDRVLVFDIGAGGLTPVLAISTPVDSEPQNLAVADLEGDGDMDIFVAHADSGFSVLTNTCNGFSVEDHPAQWVSGNNAYEGGPTLDKRIAVAEGWCPGQPNGLAIAIGWATRVGVKCVDEDGNLPTGGEPHGQSDPLQGFLDYGFELFPDSFSAGGVDPTVAGLAFEDGELFALRNGEATDFRRLWYLPPSKCAFASGLVLTQIAELGSGGVIRDMATYRRTPGEANWTGFAFVGAPGLGLVH